MVLLHSLYFQSLEILHKYESRGEAILNIGLDFGDDITANNLKKATTKHVWPVSQGGYKICQMYYYFFVEK